MRALLMAGTIAALAGAAAADVVGNIEFGTEFTFISGGGENTFGFSASGMTYTEFSDVGGGHHFEFVYFQDAHLLTGATELMTYTGAPSPAVTEGSNLRLLDRGGLGFFGGTVAVSHGGNGGDFGGASSDASIEIALETPWFIGFETTTGQRGFVQYEYDFELKVPGKPEFGGNTYYKHVGWAIEVEPSDDDLLTFDVRNGIPAPTTAGLLGLAGIAATRRRR